MLRDLDRGLIVAVGVTPANVPEARVTDALATAVAAQQSTLQELHLDRAYLASPLVQQRPDTLTIFCKDWPVHQGPCFSKNAFQLDWERHPVQGPGGERMPFVPGEVVKFPAATCARCALRSAVQRVPLDAVSPSIPLKRCCKSCANARHRRAVRRCGSAWRWNTPWHTWGAGKADTLAIGGGRKNVFALRRYAVVHNLHVLARLIEPKQQAA